MKDSKHASLEKENIRLKSELDKLQNIIRMQKKGGQAIGSGLLALFLGPSLVISIKNYLDANDKGGKISSEIRANLYASIGKRVLYVGFAGAIIALAPILLLIWQNIELQKQSQLFADQMAIQQKTELNKIIFKEDRQRQEAIKIFLKDLKNSNDNNKKNNLVAVNMAEIVMPNTDFSNSDIRNSVMVYSVFEASLFNDSYLDYIRAAYTDFTGANFINASLRKADLTGSMFINANLTNADFRGARIQAVNFTGAILKGANFQGACYIESDEYPQTIWPTGFDPEKEGILNTGDCNIVD